MYSSNRAYPLFLFFSIFIMISISGFVLYQILPKNDNFIFFSPPKKSIYFLRTTQNDNLLKQNNILTNYNNVLSKLQQRIKNLGYSIKTIYPEDIPSLKKNDILFIMDNYTLSREEFFNIKSFLEKGGNLIINYQFGKYNPLNINYIQKITNLIPLNKKLFKKDLSFFTFKLLSPIAPENNIKASFITLYGNDYINLYKNPPLLALTNWALTSTPKNLPIKEAGIAWSGFYKKGKWIYFNIPAYSFLDMNDETFNTLFKNIFSYFLNPVTLKKYPFLDKKSAIFISEDTEYKYTNVKFFAALTNKLEINSTLFCVANLAQKNQNLTKEVAKLPNIEIASHSLDHKKITPKNAYQEIVMSKTILEKITKQKIEGFRPPREEINKEMLSYLKKNYLYVMAKSIPLLKPKIEDNFVIIPRHGSDDYLYLIQYNFNDKKILNNLIKEATNLSYLNILYTLSVHTHLLSSPQNIHLLNEFFKYIKTNKIPTLKGKDIAKRALLLNKISLHIDTITERNIFIGITNNNQEEIKNFTFRIYYPNIKITNISPEVLKIKSKIIKTDKKRRFVDVRIKKLYPKSTISLIINYENF